MGDDELRGARLYVLARHGDCMGPIGRLDCLVRLRPEIVVKVASFRELSGSEREVTGQEGRLADQRASKGGGVRNSIRS